MNKKSLITFILISFCAIATSNELPVNPDNLVFGRYVENDSQHALQMPIVRYQDQQGRSVDLVAAVHVGDAAYYATLNEKFKNYDAVLFEAVMPENARIQKNTKMSEQGPITMLQHGMKNVLDLTYQMDQVDYSAKNFVHADMTPQEMSKSMADKGESIITMMIKLWRAGVVQQLKGGSMSNTEMMMALMSGDASHQLKILMAKEMINMDETLGMLEGSEGSTLITERNKKAFKVLRREMLSTKNKRLAVFYGAGHLKDMSQRLINDFEMKPVSIEWIDAWDLKK
ncbi:hypothetical protein [Marinicella rhabdoformis]|uniref:hypothetical protein n=1 Tax=Marinicella rhabdoformis TaxID=2580566 RepID=UPI0012AEB4AB|nr:hypothetical protein [Marinicella rhabdoformis]